MLLARSGLSPVMIGRGRELERLRRLLVPARDPRIALISGEAGVGKTRLVQELLAGLPAGSPVLVGHAEQGAMGRPFELLLDAAEPVVSSWDDVPAALEGRRDALGLLLRPVAPRLGVGGDPALTPEELLRAAVDLVRHLTAGGAGSAVVVFEDLHWADAESLSLFGRLATTPGLPLLLVGTFRPEDLDRRHVTDLLAAVERHRSVEHAGVARLGEDEVADLLAAVYGRPVPFTVAAELHRRTGGNPFFIEELIVASGSAAPEDLECRALPASLTEAVLRHLDGLDPVARQVIDAAAVLGHRIPFDLLGAVTGLGEDDAIAVLRTLVDRGLIVEIDTDVFSFRHALTREAVANRLLGRERRRLHEKALLALQESGSDDFAALAHHASGAHRWDELIDIARDGAAHYLRTGSTWQALRLAEAGLHESDEDTELLELAARAAWSVGLPESAIERAEHWRRLADASGDDHSLARALRLLARIRWETGDAGGQRAAAEEALVVGDRLEPGEELARIHDLQAEVSMLSNAYDDAVRWADRGLALVEETGATAVRAALLVNKGSATLDGGDVERGPALILEGVDLAEATGDGHSALRGLNNLSRHAFWHWPPERSAELLDRMSALVERFGRRDWTGAVRVLRAEWAANVDGDLVTALELVDAALAEHLSLRREVTWALVRRVQWTAEASDPATALAAVEEVGRSLMRDDRNSADRMVFVAARAAVHARAGRLDAARADLDDLQRRAAPRGCADWDQPAVWQRALVGALRSGLPADEARHRRDAFDWPEVDVFGDPAVGHLLDGVLLEADGDARGALDAYRAALAVTRNRPPSDTAEALAGAARCLLALGDVAAAGEAANTAREVLVRWPGWRRDDVDALLRRLGGGAEVAGPPALTPREREVAALVAEGCSNGEIAARLYISTKTASVHVSNILTKLGMSSRAEIAAWAVRAGLG